MLFSFQIRFQTIDFVPCFLAGDFLCPTRTAVRSSRFLYALRRKATAKEKGKAFKETDLGLSSASDPQSEEDTDKVLQTHKVKKIRKTSMEGFRALFRPGHR